MTSPRFLLAATVLGVAMAFTVPVPAPASAAGAPPAVVPAAGTATTGGAAVDEEGATALAAVDGTGDGEEAEDVAFPWAAVGTIVLVVAGIGFRAWQMFGRRSKRSSGAESPTARNVERPRDG
ncbi:hypothetical protein O4J56_19640 [Nocardiopsis sp. RSe5-2]|uniref:Uncharacterized protein n=1 Tax=Nocardiopsis endophytica TaxID=3018445 RepID=A0ABT4U7D2_9ACTN|nr:hypothetical protein [Nocardiopsis endophytica]MDA2812868.1 hypothetical protein [Nocardiopsis endophytica]